MRRVGWKARAIQFSPVPTYNYRTVTLQIHRFRPFSLA